MSIADYITLISSLGALAGVIFGFYKWRAEKPTMEKKSSSESENIMGEAAKNMSEAYDTTLKALSERVRALEADRDIREKEMDVMRFQIARLELDKEKLIREGEAKDKRITELEQHVKHLQLELDKYKK